MSLGFFFIYSTSAALFSAPASYCYWNAPIIKRLLMGMLITDRGPKAVYLCLFLPEATRVICSYPLTTAIVLWPFSPRLAGYWVLPMLIWVVSPEEPCWSSVVFMTSYWGSFWAWLAPSLLSYYWRLSIACLSTFDGITPPKGESVTLKKLLIEESEDI